ncbi:MAG: FAD binding domain-containing protein [Anaerolineales bacterium]|nr:FAD binding domain-containing protein [Anaerolineales bacterium]
MIIEYHRPQSVDETLVLLARAEPVTLPLAGGSALNRPSPDAVAVVDLQALGLDGLERRGHLLALGATLTLERLLHADDLPPALLRAIRHEATYNLRQVASLAGTILAADGRSPFTTAMLALDAQMTLLPGEEQLALGDLLPLRGERMRGRLVTQVTIPANARLSYAYVARTPADLPLVCAALAQWPSGRTRLALGGYALAPCLALDGPEVSGVEAAASSAYAHAADEWASAEYRSQAAGVLARRCLQDLNLEGSG